MTLYNPGTSAASRLALTTFVKNIFGMSSKARVYVAGRRNNRCLSVRGDGRLQNTTCASGFNSVCEINVPVVKCTDYTELEIVAVTPEFNAVSCEYIGSITSENTRIFTTAAKTSQEITRFNAVNVEYLPADIAKSFPNLRMLHCYPCEIKKLTALSLRGLTKLQFLSVASQYLEELNIDAFRDLSGLQMLIVGMFSSSFPEFEYIYIKFFKYLEHYFKNTLVLFVFLPICLNFFHCGSFENRSKSIEEDQLWFLRQPLSIFG